MKHSLLPRSIRLAAATVLLAAGATAPAGAFDDGCGYSSIRGSAAQDSAICGVRIDWYPAFLSSTCTSFAGPVVYNIYRFVAPDQYIPLRTCLPLAQTSLFLDGFAFLDEPMLAVGVEELGAPGSGVCGGGRETFSGAVHELRTAFSGGKTPLARTGSASDFTATHAGDPAGAFEVLVRPADAEFGGRWYWHRPDPYGPSESTLRIVDPVDVAAGRPTRLQFAQRVDTNGDFSGGVLEYSTNGGATWFDILAGNGAGVPANANRITKFGYRDRISADHALDGRLAWLGSYNDWPDTRVDLADFAGTPVSFRFRYATEQDDPFGSHPFDGWDLLGIEAYQYEACLDSRTEIVFRGSFD